MNVNNKTSKYHPSFLLNYIDKKENTNSFISPPESVIRRKSDIKFDEFMKMKASSSNKKRISLYNLKDGFKDQKKNHFPSNILNLKSPDALLMKLNDTTFPKANLSSQSIAEFSFPYVDGDIRQSNARAKYLLSREIHEIMKESNQSDKIKDENKKQIAYNIKNFKSVIDPIKKNLEDLKNIISGVDKDAKDKILQEKNSLQKGLQKFLDRAEKNYKTQLEKKMIEILGLLNSIQDFNHDKFESYLLIKKKIEDLHLKKMELVLKTDKLKEDNKNLTKEYYDKIHYRKNLIEFINERKIKISNNNNSHSKLGNSDGIHSPGNNFSKCHNSEKLDNVKFSLIKSFKELELKNKKLKNNFTQNTKKNINEITHRIFEIINEHKQNKQEFRFSTTIKNFHQNSKEKFYTAKTRFSLDKNMKFSEETNDSSVNIKSLIELFVKDQAIITKFMEFNKTKKDNNPLV